MFTVCVSGLQSSYGTQKQQSMCNAYMGEAVHPTPLSLPSAVECVECSPWQPHPVRSLPGLRPTPIERLPHSGSRVAQEFLEANKLRLILRSHEGPDARSGREDLPDMSQGFTIDHVTPAGRLLTVFSAPDYPQFQARSLGSPPHPVSWPYTS